uniref:C2H2-type domain-containing protein n=1 Tax=Bracon brevicornis TaxID=1563983 RepID=A0A6V7L5E7_9HYME
MADQHELNGNRPYFYIERNQEDNNEIQQSVPVPEENQNFSLQVPLQPLDNQLPVPQLDNQIPIPSLNYRLPISPIDPAQPSTSSSSPNNEQQQNNFLQLPTILPPEYHPAYISQQYTPYFQKQRWNPALELHERRLRSPIPPGEEHEWCIACHVNIKCEQLMKYHSFDFHSACLLQCPDCKRICSSPYLYQIHRIVDHNWIPDYGYADWFCRKCFAFISHAEIAKHHMLFCLPNETGKFKCPKCSMTFMDMSACMDHAQIHCDECAKAPGKCGSIFCPYLPAPAVSGLSEASNLAVKLQSIGVKFPCRFCVDEFDSIGARKEHEKIHDKLICRWCQRRCPDNQALIVHMAIAHEYVDMSKLKSSDKKKRSNKK